MNLVNYEEFKKTESYQNFIEENSSIGTLKVEVFTAYQAIPIPDTEIVVTKDIDGEKILFFTGKTNSSGMISNIELPAPKEETDYKPGVSPKYTRYDVTAIHEGYERIKKYDIAIFGNTGVIQYIKMIPEVDIEGEL